MQSIKRIIKCNTTNFLYQHDDPFVKEVIKDPDFPFLVSFPRTGSHWLRMVMEIYFERPALTRIFFYKDKKNFTCYHTHDIVGEELGKFKRNAVCYLFRNGPETIYSHLNYHQENINDRKRIKLWAQLYGAHLIKWLITDDFTLKKIVLRYDKMEIDMASEFKKLCDFFGETFDDEKFEIALKRTSKELVNKNTKDNRVINLQKDYQENRAIFIKNHGAFVADCIFELHHSLHKLFD